MKKINWVIGLSLTGLLVASGAAYAFGNTLNSENTAVYTFTSTAANSVVASQEQGQAVHTLYTPTSVSGNQQTPNPYTYGSGQGFGGYGMMGGYGDYGGYGNNGIAGGTAGNYWGCGGYGGYGGYGASISTKDDSSLQSDTNASMQNAKVDKANNTITYTGDNVKLVILGGPEQADGKFVIDGLVNPTLQIPKGATVTVEFANADQGMPHGFEVTNAAPPYYFMTMMEGGIYPGSLIGFLPEAQNGQNPTVQTSFKADYAGTFYYICQYPGHAEKGMYGKLIIQ